MDQFHCSRRTWNVASVLLHDKRFGLDKVIRSSICNRNWVASIPFRLLRVPLKVRETLQEAKETCWQIQLLKPPLSPYQERKDVQEYYLSPNGENFILSAPGGHSMGSNSTSPQVFGRSKGNQRITLPRSMGNNPILLHIP